MTYYSRYGRAVVACLLAALAAFLLAGRIDATSIRLPLSEIDARSALVVRGQVERIESGWNAERQIESTVYVRLSAIPRGHLSTGALLPVRVLGGTVDGLTMVSSEEPVFEAGEDVYLFLGELKRGAYRVTAGEQGKFTIAGGRAVNRAWQADLQLSDLDAGVIEGRWPAEPNTPDSSAPSLGAAPQALLPGPSALAGAGPDDYQYNNAKWFGPNPMEESYRININTGDAGGANGSYEAFRNAILWAAGAWNDAGAAFSFKYGGTTGATSWAADDQNVIYWQDLGNVTTLAETQWWKYDNGQIVDVDLRFNDYYAWDATGSPSSNEPDLQTVATHELGHFLSLAHDTDGNCPYSTPVMCASYVMGTVKRSLGANDIAGIKAIYGAGQPAADLHPDANANADFHAHPHAHADPHAARRPVRQPPVRPPIPRS